MTSKSDCQKGKNSVILLPTFLVMKCVELKLMSCDETPSADPHAAVVRRAGENPALIRLNYIHFDNYNFKCNSKALFWTGCFQFPYNYGLINIHRSDSFGRENLIEKM